MLYTKISIFDTHSPRNMIQQYFRPFPAPYLQTVKKWLTLKTEQNRRSPMWLVDGIFVLLGVILPGCASIQSQLVRASGICCCRPNCLRDPSLSTDSFRRLLKTRLFSEYSYMQRIRGIALYALHKFTTYLLTYLLTKITSNKNNTRKQLILPIETVCLNVGLQD